MFNISEYLRARRCAINKALAREMPRPSERPTLLHKAMRYAVVPGGKRLRPIVCLASCDAVGGRPVKAMMPALAIEVLHAYTLVHDDLPCMDDSPTRRGRPSAHVMFGEANAVLVGDALQALAFEWTASALPDPPCRSNDLVLELARAAGSKGVAAGQFEDLAFAGKTPDKADLKYVHLLKTAALFRASARIGGMVGGAGRKELAALTDYGVKLGLAFQIVDDIMDAGVSRDAPRQPARRDRPPETTCLTAYSPAEASRRARRLIAEAQAAISALGNRGVPLSSLGDHVLTALVRKQ